MCEHDPDGVQCDGEEVVEQERGRRGETYFVDAISSMHIRDGDGLTRKVRRQVRGCIRRPAQSI